MGLNTLLRYAVHVIPIMNESVKTDVQFLLFVCLFVMVVYLTVYNTFV